MENMNNMIPIKNWQRNHVVWKGSSSSISSTHRVTFVITQVIGHD